MSRGTRIVLALALAVTALTGPAEAGDPGLVDPYQEEADGLVDPYEGLTDPYPEWRESPTETGLVDPYQDESAALVDPDQDRWVDPYLEALLPDMRSLRYRPRY
jgi:hypothetical protein